MKSFWDKYKYFIAIVIALAICVGVLSVLSALAVRGVMCS